MFIRKVTKPNELIIYAYAHICVHVYLFKPLNCQHWQTLIKISVFALFQYTSTGCNLTKCCRERCTKLGITGWVKNTKAGTVLGKMQGKKADVDTM